MNLQRAWVHVAFQRKTIKHALAMAAEKRRSVCLHSKQTPEDDKSEEEKTELQLSKDRVIILTIGKYFMLESVNMSMLVLLYLLPNCLSINGDGQVESLSFPL